MKSFNKQYKPRLAPRFNPPGYFSSAQEASGAPRWGHAPAPAPRAVPPPAPRATNQVQLKAESPAPVPLPVPPPAASPAAPAAPPGPAVKPFTAPPALPPALMMTTDDVDMSEEPEDAAAGDHADTRPNWMKSKLPGVKKISNKERRRRQNAHLRRLLSPKNALMALNELLLNEHIPNEFKVEQSLTKQFFNSTNYCADLTVQGKVYTGYGETKISARNSAAEQAIRDIMIKRMSKILTTDGPAGGDAGEDEALPMIQLASFALHKLFTEWEFDGHKVPQLRPPPTDAEPAGAEGTKGAAGAAGDEPPASAPDAAGSAGGAGTAAGAGSAAGTGAAGAAGAGAGRRGRGARGDKHSLPLNAAHMHPCMLLTYMRPQQQYKELGAAGDKPQNMTFTVGVQVDGQIYVGKASNKKEARKEAARLACATLFGVTFEAHACATKPLLATAGPTPTPTPTPPKPSTPPPTNTA